MCWTMMIQWTRVCFQDEWKREKHYGGRGNHHYNRSLRRGSGQFNNRRYNRGRNSSRGNNNNSNSQSSEMKIVPHYTGKQQMFTYDTVKDHLVQHIQKTFNYEYDIDQAIRDMVYDNENDIGGGRPTRKIVAVPIDKDTRESLHMKLPIEQEGYDI